MPLEGVNVALAVTTPLIAAGAETEKFLMFHCRIQKSTYSTSHTIPIAFSSANSVNYHLVMGFFRVCFYNHVIIPAYMWQLTGLHAVSLDRPQYPRSDENQQLRFGLALCI